MTTTTMRLRFLPFALLFLAAPLGTPLAAQAGLRAGPMTGYSEMREAMVWLQTDAPAEVAIEYWDSAAPGRRYRTDTAFTLAATAFTARFPIGLLEPGRVYHYRPVIDGRPVDRPYPMRFVTQSLWQWRADPPPFTVALGSCLYVNDPPYDRPGAPYGGEYEILQAIHDRRPDAMVWLGDNVYLREADWYSRSGILYRYGHTRALPHLQPLLAGAHHYAIWDDHDYGPNDSDRSFRDRADTHDAFRLFWGNPTYGMPGLPGITTMFAWADVEFFLLDDRTHRTPNRRNTGDDALLGDDQLRWLVDALAASHAPFRLVVVGGQVLNPSGEGETWAAVAPDERDRLLRLLREEDIWGVMFLTGDRHFTELSRLDRPGTYPLYDLTVSPLTAGPYPTGRDEANPLRVQGTFHGARNFATLAFSGPRTDRVMEITVRDVQGREVWTWTIAASELRPRP
ncbi:MAG TPA: alkaline phosphatase D family protein [Longimicrobiales bacterium]|nr:alkaline phosphatase D family protein [Longimicrobiales bacterium]